MIPRIARVCGLYGVAALEILLVVACGGGTPPGGAAPDAPTLLSLEIPSDAFGRGFTGVQPTVRASTTPADYVVLPLLPTTAPIVRAILSTPTNSSLTVTASNAGGPPVALPFSPSSSPGSATGYYQVLNATSGWHIVIRYPNSFQGSKSIRTMITDTVGGVASGPLTFDMTFRGSMLTVAIATANNDGRVTSNPPGIDCPGVCSFEFLDTANSVQLTQSVLHNQTQFIGWTGGCAGTGNSCTVPLFGSPPAPSVPSNPMVTANFRIHANTQAGVEEITLVRSTDPGDDQFVFKNPLLLFMPPNAVVSNVVNVSRDVNGNGVKLELVRHNDANGVMRSLPAANCPAAPLEPQASTSIFNGETVEGEWKVRAVCISQAFLNGPPARMALQIAWTQ